MIRIVNPAQLLSRVVDFCYPGACAVCQQPAPGAQPICTSCDNELRLLELAAACEHCAMPLAAPDAPCPHCDGKGIGHFQCILRLGIFADPLKHLVHQVKYHHRWPLAEFLAGRLFARERVKGLLTETQVIVPVPLHIVRHVQRGYNQAEVLARRLASLARVKLALPAVRLRHTPSQTQMTSQARREANLRDAFGLVRPESIRGRHVVVVDDVMTTGATLRSFARCLHGAKPASLCAIVIAAADPRHRDFETI